MNRGSETELTLDIFIHLEAIDRNAWTGANDDRPLTDRGAEQSQAMAELILADGPVQALFSSPALRCLQSLEPLAQKTALAIEVLPGFRDTLGYRAPEGWQNPDRPGPDPLGGAYSAGCAFDAFQELQRRPGVRRAVLCSYGDIVPVFLAFLAGYYSTPVPARSNARGFIYRVHASGDQVTLESRAAPESLQQ